MKQDEVFKSPDLLKVIEARKSVRAFSEKPVSDKLIAAFKSYIKTAKCPFGNDARLHLINIETGEYPTTSRKCTRGLISGAKWFLAAEVSEQADYALIQTGYAMQRAVLYLTALGLSGCYLGSGFDKALFNAYAAKAEDSIVPVIFPFGYSAEKPTVMASIARKFAGGDSRKEFEDIFYEWDFSHTLNHIQCGDYYGVFEAVRQAPSSRNGQPWRIVKCGSSFHFYKYCAGRASGEFDLAEVDMGISFAHFALASADAGFDGEFYTADDFPKNGDTYDYVASFSSESARRVTPVATGIIADY